MPLPPYIERPPDEEDETRYQTVFARRSGAIAAPTAGLHFTPELLAAISARGVARAEIVLHVGAGTFKPVEVDDPARHVMHEEWYSVPEATAERVLASSNPASQVAGMAALVNVIAEADRGAFDESLASLAAAFQQRMGEVHVTAVDGANPFGYVAAAVEGVLGLARSAGLELPKKGS